MTLEQRISQALHEVDAFDPSPDLFARVERSLEEDAAHRHRVRLVWLVSVAAAAAVVLFLGLAMSRSESGYLTIPRWAALLLETLLMITFVLVLAPVIRRFGAPYVSDVFRLDPAAGARFMPLLDIAYYLVFSGLILARVTTTGLGNQILLTRALATSLERISVLLGVMGVMHSVTLLGLPMMGLIFSAIVRRDARRRAGAAAPSVSPRALQADRVASRVVWIAAGLLLVLTLVGIGMLLGVGISTGS